MRWSVVKGIMSQLFPRTILEIGCGQGSFGSRLARRAAYLGLEQTAASCALARERTEPLGGGVRDAGWAELVDVRQFDLVCAFEVLEHLEEDGAVLRAWRELVASRGSLVISMPAWPERFNAWDRGDGHLRRYAPDPNVQLLQDAGFVNATAVVYGWLLGFVLEAARAKVAARKEAFRPDEGDLSMEERTARIGRTFQPTDAWGRLGQIALLQFVAAQRWQPRRGTGVDAVARRPDL